MARRRSLAVVLAALIALALMVPAVLAAEVTSAYDSFDEPIYSGGSGWIGNWTETGETTNPLSGVIQVVSSGCEVSNCVRFESLVSIAVGLQRSANFEGAENISLTFRYRKSGGTLDVRARTGSGSWQTVDTLGNSGVYTNASVDLSDYASPTTQIMFFSTIGLLSSAYIDDVSITASYPTTTTSTTTTTTEPIITVPTITIPPPLTTTTTVSSSTTTTSGGTGSSTTTTTTTAEGSGSNTTTSTTPPGTGGEGSDSPPGGESSGDGDQATVTPPLTEEQLDFAAESNIVVNLAGVGDFGGFEPGIGVNPMTDLWVNLNTTVEAISTEILSALALGVMIAFFGVRRVTDDDPVSQS